MVLLGLASPSVARAHDFNFTDVLVVLKTNGTYQIDVTLDADALALGVSPDTDSAAVAAELEALSAAELAGRVEQAGDTVLRRVRVRFDEVKQQPQVSFPELESPLAGEGAPTVLGTTARLTGRVPPRAQEFSFGASRVFPVIELTLFEQATGNVVKYTLGAAEDSPPYKLGSSAARAPGRLEVAARYLILGFEHILPRGLDHMLFVLGLFLLSTRLRALFWQITAFTLAHSVTLGLSIYGVVSLPSRLVETLIALSIAYVAMENLATAELKPWRPALVFLFGLLHGLGFAGALRELGLPRGEFATALVTFNAGVELGQLSVVLLAFLLVGWARRRNWYRKAIVLPASAAIALVGLYWAFERALGHPLLGWFGGLSAIPPLP